MGIKQTLTHKINGWLKWWQMNKERRMELSRDSWKEKARIRADEIRDFRKVRRADRERIQTLATENKQLKEDLKKKT